MSIANGNDLTVVTPIFVQADQCGNHIHPDFFSVLLPFATAFHVIFSMKQQAF